MSTHGFMSSRALMGAAIMGLVGAAGMLIYEQIYAEKRRAMLVKEVARLDNQVATMRSELEALRELQKETQIRRLKHRKTAPKKPRVIVAPPAGDIPDPELSYASDSEYFTDYQSVLGTDHEMDSEEFYDVHTDDDDDTLRDDNLSVANGKAPAMRDKTLEKDNVTSQPNSA